MLQVSLCKSPHPTKEPILIVGLEGFEPTQPEAPDLQSGTDRQLCSNSNNKKATAKTNQAGIIFLTTLRGDPLIGRNLGESIAFEGLSTYPQLASYLSKWQDSNLHVG